MIVRITFVLLLIAIAYLSLTPTDTITVGNDKISHFLAYSTLMFVGGIMSFSSRKMFYKTILFCLFYGAAMEIGQHFVPGRFMSLYDMFANALGVIIGIVLTLIFYKLVIKILKKTRLI